MATSTADASCLPTLNRIASSCASERVSGPCFNRRSRGRSVSGQSPIPPPIFFLFPETHRDKKMSPLNDFVPVHLAPSKASLLLRPCLTN